MTIYDLIETETKNSSRKTANKQNSRYEGNASKIQNQQQKHGEQSLKTNHILRDLLRDCPSRGWEEVWCFGSVLTSFSARPGQTLALWSAPQAEHICAKRHELEGTMQQPLFQDLHFTGAERFPTGPGRLPRTSTSRDTSGMKILWPTSRWPGKLLHHTTTKLLISPQDQELILGQILPAEWEIKSEDHDKNGESLHPSDDVVNVLTRSLRVAGQDHTTIKEQLWFWFRLSEVGL